jgi:hypothetical protein
MHHHTRSPLVSLRVRFASILVGLAASLGAQSLNLSGKVVEAEEGNGLGSVEVALAVAGHRTITAKNGTWTLASSASVAPEGLRHQVRPGDGLRVEDGRLLVRLDGRDLLGRGSDIARGAPGRFAARAFGVLDTLVFTRTGFVTRRVPVSSLQQSGLVDSLRRIRYPGWVDPSHSNGFPPDTIDAFPDTLRTLTLRVAKPAWDAMMKRMSDSCGRFGTPTTCQVAEHDHVDNAALVWVAGDLEADGQVWRNVGIRLKGNNSLSTTWAERKYSLPFRVTMDKFEDSLPVTKNQRFHGFKKLSLYNAAQDGSDIREAVAGEIFRGAGVPSALSVPVRVKLVHGDTARDLGAYELVEVPDAPLLNRWFGEDSGHLYKPMSDLSTFVDSEFFDEDLVTDYADVKALIAALNASSRTTSPAAWRGGLEKVFDVRTWIRWLAISSAIGNWDSYGENAHNYYLYNDAGVLRWITYDLGWSLVPVTEDFLWHERVVPGGAFPLVGNLLADPVYCREYRAQIEAAISDTGAFSAARFRERVDRYGKMVAVFPEAARQVKELRTYADTRHPQIRTQLAGHPCP